MEERLLIRLLPHTEQVEWRRVGGKASARASLAERLEDIPADARQLPCTLFVPGSEVLLVRLDLPKRRRAKAKAAIPFLLEDRVIDDIAETHFAYGPDLRDGGLPVAIVSKVRMAEWLRRLSDAGLRARHVLPEYLIPAAPESGKWTVHLEPSTAHVRMGLASGFSADSTALPALIGSFSDSERPAHIEIFHCDGAAQAADTLFADHDSITCHSLTSSLLLDTMDLSEIHTGLNLLQGEFALNNPGRRYSQRWAYAAAAVMFWATISVAVAHWENYQLRQQKLNTEQELTELYKSLFPNSQRIIKPRNQAESKLSELRRGGTADDTGLMRLLSVAGTSLMQHPSASIQRVNFRNGQLDLELQVQDLQTLDSIKGNITDSGLTAELQGTTRSDTGINARMQIRSTST